MKLEPSLQKLEASLMAIKPSQPSSKLFGELESALSTADEVQTVAPSNIIQGPFGRWTVAAAAMVAALMMAVSSTRVNDASGILTDESAPTYDVVPDSEIGTMLPVDTRLETHPTGQTPTKGDVPNLPVR